MHTKLISPQDLAALHDDAADLVVFDCRFDLAAPESGYTDFLSGRLPGARYLHLDRDLSGPRTGKNGRHPLPDRDAFAERMRQHGVNDATQVVAYDAQGALFAARLWWMLRWLGHEAVAVLDGGLQAWRRAGLPFEGGMFPMPGQALRGDLRIGPTLAAMVDVDRMFANLDSRELLLIDARSADRYRGENETLDPRAGHIPGARNRFFRSNLKDDGSFKPAADLRAEFAALLGDTAPESVVQQCGSGVTACHNLLAMEVAGLGGSALYPGSWSEWSADPGRPIAVGPDP